VTTGTVVVTGAAGFVGWHVCRGLLEAGWAVIGVDNFDPYYARAVKQAGLALLEGRPAFRFAEVDVRDLAAMRALVECADAVVHLAARPGVRQSVAAPEVYRAINEHGTARLLDACAAAGVRRLVFASSSSVYGTGASVPFREDEPLGDPASPYAATKQAGERSVSAFVRDSGGRAAVVRLFSVYGPRQRPDLVLHAFAGRMRAGLPVPIYGDGGTRRDYTHAADIARGILRAVEWTGAGGSTCEVFNLGSGEPVRLDLLVSELARGLGVEPRLDRRPAHPADLPVTWAGTAKARRALGFEARVTIRAGIADFVSWYEREHGRQSSPAA
jgi:UDP-glucuronate 4-epimerase